MYRAILQMVVQLIFILPGFSITVDGNVYLENTTNHNNIYVEFQRFVPDSLTYSATTNPGGYFTRDIETGIYHITYSKTGCPLKVNCCICCRIHSIQTLPLTLNTHSIGV